jgi:CRP/FNR family cyclic AMP-dependent transcriptional regulator
LANGSRVESDTEALQRIPLFAGLSDEQLATLASETIHHRYERSEIVFHRGDPGDRAFIILSGAVDLVIESADGRELILSRLDAGEHFGEMALLDDLSRSATARAAAPSELVAVLRQTFLRALHGESEMGQSVIRSLVQRLRAADEKLEAFAYLDAEGRVARVVLDLAGNGQIRASHEELAHMAATSRQTTTRVLGDWEEAGYVTLSRRGLVVKDMTALQALAQL